MAWLPLAVVLALLGWMAFGQSAARDDLIRWLLELSILSGYALAAAGMAYLSWRRWSYRLDDDDKRRLWAGAMGGHRGPLAIFVTNALMYLAFVALFLAFFWQAR